MSSRVAIFCEDKYGESFLKKLATLLKDNDLIDKSVGVDAYMFYRPCNSKLESQLSIKADNGVLHFRILVDCDGRDKLELRRRVEQHIPKNLKENTKIILLDYAIEDWLCAGLGEQLNEKSTDILKKKFFYEKNQLPSYVSKMDLAKMMDSESFREFVYSLNGI